MRHSGKMTGILAEYSSGPAPDSHRLPFSSSVPGNGTRNLSDTIKVLRCARASSVSLAPGELKLTNRQGQTGNGPADGTKTVIRLTFTHGSVHLPLNRQVPRVCLIAGIKREAGENPAQGRYCIRREVRAFCHCDASCGKAVRESLSAVSQKTCLSGFVRCLVTRRPAGRRFQSRHRATSVRRRLIFAGTLSPDPAKRSVSVSIITVVFHHPHPPDCPRRQQTGRICGVD